jgi:hypothetical protein
MRTKITTGNGVDVCLGLLMMNSGSQTMGRLAGGRLPLARA